MLVKSNLQKITETFFRKFPSEDFIEQMKQTYSTDAF